MAGTTGAQVCIFEEGDTVGLNRFLQSTVGLEAPVGLEVLSDLAGQALKGELADADQELSWLLGIYV